MSFAKSFLKVTAFFFGVLALVIFSAVFTMKLITWGRTVDVPDVTGRDLTTAINQLKNSGLEIKVGRQEHHPKVPAGNIVSQSPPPGASVKKGRDVLVIVSLGSEEVVAPDLTGEALRRAQVSIKQAGLVMGDSAKAYSDAPRDGIITQSPLPRSVMQKGEALALLISGGLRPVRYVTPVLIGMTPAQAVEAVKPLSVKLTVAGTAGLIASQEPKPGYPVASGGGITVKVARKEQAPANPAPAAKPAAPVNENRKKERT